MLCSFFVPIPATNIAGITVQMLMMMMKMKKILTQKHFYVCKLQFVSCIFAGTVTSVECFKTC